MLEDKTAIINVSKGVLGVSLTVLAAIGAATGNVWLAGTSAVPGAIMASGLLDLLPRHKDDYLELPVPPWWTEGRDAWQDVCGNIEAQLPAILEGVPLRLQQGKIVPTAQGVHQAFYEEVLQHLPPYVSSQDRALLAYYVTPLLLGKSAQVLQEAITPLREEALIEGLSHIVALLDAAQRQENPSTAMIATRVVESTASKWDVISELERKRREDLYDVYINYADADETEVMKIGERIKERGILPWFDAIDADPGRLARPQQEEQIRKIPAAAVFIGQQAIAGGQALQMYSFIEQFVQRGCRVIPVVLPGVSGELQLPVYLANFAGVDFRQQEPEPLTRLLWGITGKREKI